MLSFASKVHKRDEVASNCINSCHFDDAVADYLLPLVNAYGEL